MHVTHITAAGFKGRGFSHDLAPLTHITGVNFSGKTSRLAAIQLALLGYIPGDPPKRTSAAIMDFALSTELVVDATLSDGSTYARRFWQEDDGMHSKGPEQRLDIPILDAAAFFKMGATERLAYTFSKVPLPDTFSIDGIMASVKNIKTEGEDHEAALTQVAAKVRTVLERDGVNAGLIALLKEKGGDLRAIITYQKRREKETIGHVRIATELRTREGECSAETIAALTMELAAAREKEREATAKKAAFDERSRAASRTNSRRNDITKQLQTKARNFESEIITKEIELQTASEPLVEPPGDTLAKAAHEADKAFVDATTAAQWAEATVAKARNNLASVETLECCPTCKSKGKGFHDRIKALYEEELEDATAHAPVANEALTRAREAARRASEALANRLDYEEATRERTRLCASLKRDIAELRQMRDVTADKRKALAEELARLSDAEQVTPEEAEVVTDDLVAALEACSEITDRRDAAVALAQDIKRAAEAAHEHDIAAATLEVATAVLSVLRETQATMIAQCIGVPLAFANRIVADILPSPLAFHEGELGRWEGSRFIKTATFSGTEEALVYIGFSAALSSTASIRLAIIDEFDRLDVNSQQFAVQRLTEAVRDGLLDQVIIAGPRIPDCDFTNWTHIGL